MKVLDGQTLLDIAIQLCGSAEAAYDIALLNGLCISDDLVVGRELMIPDVLNKQINSYYTSKDLRPATGISLTSSIDIPPALQGIGYWAIETEFIIS